MLSPELNKTATPKISKGSSDITLNKVWDSLVNNDFYNQVAKSKWELMRKGTIGGISGVLSKGPTPYTLGTLARYSMSKYPESSTVYKVANWYEKHFDPRVFVKKQLDIKVADFNTQNNAIQKILDDNQKIIDNLKSQINTNASNPELETKLSKFELRNKYLSSTDFLDKDLGKLKLQDLKIDMAKNPELFNNEEIDLLDSREATLIDMTSIEKELTNASKFWGGRGIFANFAKGASFDIAEELANDYLNTVLKSKQGSWSSGLLLLPLGAVIPGNIENKIAWTGGVMIAGKMLDMTIPANTHLATEKILKSSNLDAVTMSFAALLPVDSPELRGTLVIGSWLLGRLYNYYELPTGIKKTI